MSKRSWHWRLWVSLSVIALVILAVFGLASYEIAKNFSVASNVPKVGQTAPEFALADTSGTTVTLAQVLSTPIAGSGAARPPKGVLLVFYRGYW